ncbi:MAG: MFS transporter [Chloroflexota bacterium]|nr:MAG: MFS transporter [Chloroflexota bacterium]
MALAGTAANGRLILLAVVIGSGIVFLDTTIVNVALESIGRDLPGHLVARLEGLTYVTGGYLVVLAALLVLAGALSDYYGRRRVFQLGLLSFGATSIACGLAPTLELLVLARLAQGAAGAFLVPGALSIISACFQGQERARVIALWAAATSALTVAAPLLGGLVVQTLSWRAAFLVNVPLIAIGYAASRAIPESRDETATGRFDWLGSILVALAVGGLAFGAIRGRAQGWDDPTAVGGLVLGLAATVATPLAMATRPDPLIPLSLLRRRDFAVVNLATFIIYGALYVTLAFQGLFFQGTLGYTPLAAGLVAIPVDLCLVTLSTAAGRAAGRIGARPFLLGGPVAMAAGLLWLSRIPSTSPAWQADPGLPSTLLPPPATLVDVGPGILLFGIGLGVLVAPLTIALMASVPVTKAGLASALNNAVSRAGAPLVSALLFVAITASFYPALSARLPGLDVDDPEIRALVQPLTRPRPETPPDLVRAATEASTDAYRLAMVTAAALLVLGGLAGGLGLEGRRRRRATQDREEAAEPGDAIGPLRAHGPPSWPAESERTATVEPSAEPPDPDEPSPGALP